jgi:hypothetical protein
MTQATPLFKPAENTSAFLKMGLLGFQGSGKSKTAALTAIGLVLQAKKLNLDYANRPVFFLDTETGSDWLKPDFDEMGIELFVAKTRAFSDLIAAMAEAEKSGAFLIVDSITHFWKELCDSYSRVKAKKFKVEQYRLQFQDWSYLKGENGWQKFSDRFVNSPLHIAVCGRAGYEYDYFENDDGKKELEKTGVKMKAEGEFGFEPSLLVQMEMRQKVEGKAVASVWREAHVIKDRSTLIDGKTFIFQGNDEHGHKVPVAKLVQQTYGAFAPHINRLNLGGKQLGVDTARTSEHLAPKGEGRGDNNAIRRKIVLDEIQTLMLEFYPSTSKEDKQAKIALMRKHFGDEEIVWTKIEELIPLLDLRLAYDSMYRELKGKPSQYALLFEPEKTNTELNDSLPDHSAPPAAEAEKPDSDTTENDVEVLMGQLPGLTTMRECVDWGLTLASKASLSPADRHQLSLALLNRQGEIADAEKLDDKPAKAKKSTAKASAIKPADAVAAG